VLTIKLVILVVVAFPIKTEEKLRDALDLEAGPFLLKPIAQISAFCPITSEDFNLLSNHKCLTILGLLHNKLASVYI